MVAKAEGTDSADLGFDAALALFNGLAKNRVERFVELSGSSAQLAIIAYRRWGCAVDLVAMDADGRFNGPAPAWVAPYLEALTQAGIPPDRVQVIVQQKDLSPPRAIALQKP